MMPGSTAHIWDALSRRKRIRPLIFWTVSPRLLGIHLSELFADPAKGAMPPKPMSRGRKPGRQCQK